MKITEKAARAIARISRNGNRIAVFADGSYEEYIGDGGCVCLLNDDGSRTYPIMRISRQISARAVKAAFAENLAIHNAWANR